MNVAVHAANPAQVRKEKLCRIGDSGRYIGEGEECIDTQQKCESKAGIWYGCISGRGRTVGCSLPIKDAGKNAPIVRNANPFALPMTTRTSIAVATPGRCCPRARSRICARMRALFTGR
jgi:hypothetical protein